MPVMFFKNLAEVFPADSQLPKKLLELDAFAFTTKLIHQPLDDDDTTLCTYIPLDLKILIT